MLCHKISLNKFKKNEIISSILSDHTGKKHEINYTTKKKKMEKMTCYQKANRSMKISKRKSNNTLRQMKMEAQLSKVYKMLQNSSKKKV